MKTFALIALVGCASAAELTGYTIDLCPDAAGTKGLGQSIYLPGNEEALVLGQIWKQQQLANQPTEFELKMAAMKNMYQVASQQPTEFIAPQTYSTVGMETSDFKQNLASAIYERIASENIERELASENIMKELAAKNLLEQIASERIQSEMVGASVFNRLGNVIDFTPGMVEERLPGAFDIVKERVAMIPGADTSNTYFQTGFSYSPDSFSLGAQDEYLGCAGQQVLVYPERNPEVLWCGERNLQGNQTLKRTNIHHNYVHDINQLHNYHNRTKHSARQFDTVEKDCSCKGVAVEAQYSCPPGIEAPATVGTYPTVGVSLLQRPMATLAANLVGTSTCGCK